MARLPDAMDLGEPTRVRVGAPRYEDRSGEILANAGARAATQIGAAVERYAQHDDAFNYARAKSAIQSADVATQAQLSEDNDWQTHGTRYQAAMDAAREEAAKFINGSRSRALFDMDAKEAFERGSLSVQAGAKAKEGEWGRGELDNALEANRRAALEAADPETKKALIASTLDLISGATIKRYITPEQAANTRQRFTADYGEGYVDMLPDAEQLKVLKAPQGTPADYIDPAKRANMIERLTEKQRVLSDRREATAERALAQWERQIASGVPATPAMIAGWRSKIAGTSMQGEMQSMLAGEKEVQDVLRKPIGEQLRFVQERDAALKTGGGTLAQAANLERLRNAVKQNITTLQTAPLLYAETRLEEPNTPIDVAGLVDPNAVGGIRMALQDRADKIAGISKSVGTQVPMVPLLPQEAAQLSALLDSASPAQAAGIFAGLREASGSQDVFRGAMRQVAPDSPVKSMAGMLAAQQRELTTESNWFSPDETVRSRDVAATLLKGEKLLNPSKGDKSQDGKPQGKNLYLPDADALQSEFASAVGDAFQGRERAADAAMQAVRAYYVGRAAETGRIAADNTDIDSDLVREAVKATLGDVVDYNGNGSVLAPWGMAADDFEDRAEAALVRKAKELNLPDTLDLDAVGLTNGGADGEYILTFGNNLLLDAQGNPILIDLKPAGPARGVIQR